MLACEGYNYTHRLINGVVRRTIRIVRRTYRYTDCTAIFVGVKFACDIVVHCLTDHGLWYTVLQGVPGPVGCGDS